MDKLDSIQAFITVVELGGFSAAARNLNVSKAQISKQIAALEDSLGIRLLHRTTRRVSPTSNGQAYYERCKPLLDEFIELDDSIKNSDRALQGDLHISAPATFAEINLLPIITEYTKQNPNVNLKLELTDRFIDLVEERIDLAIRIGNLDESSLVARKIGKIHMLLCASPAFIKTYGLVKTVQELTELPCIMDSNYPGGNQWQLVSEHDQHTITVNGQLIVNNARVARDFVLQGKGIGFLPSFVVNEQLNSGELINILRDYTSTEIGIYAVYLHRKHLSLKVRRLIDLLTESF